jgi:hypothetical protein
MEHGPLEKLYFSIDVVAHDLETTGEECVDVEAQTFEAECAEGRDRKLL